MKNLIKVQRMFLSVIVLSLSTFVTVSAQDLITKKDGTDVKVVVEEVGTNYVKYKLFDEPDGPTYIVKKSELLMIRYASGRNEVFNNNSYNFYDDGRKPVENIVPNMKYKVLKNIYNYKEYIPTYSDRHSPAWSGVASFFIPGLGEGINNEWGRGLGKFFGSAALMTIGSVCTSLWLNNLDYIDGVHSSGWQIEMAASLVSYVAALGIDIWSIVEAVRIAKVKNMYEQDLRKLYSMDINLYPSLNCVQTSNGIQPAIGLTLALNF